MSLRSHACLVLPLVLAAGACTPTAVMPVTPPAAAAMPAADAGTAVAANRPALPPQAAVSAEVERLRTAFAHEVPRAAPRTPQSDAAWIARAQAVLAGASARIDHPQLIVVVDRAPKVQGMRIILAQPARLPWYVIGGSKVSTGQAGRHGYFITPTGVFPHTTDILDYRAEGTFNENHIRGLGLKGMRVWDFGWQTAQRGWTQDGDESEIRLLLHATDPDYLEQRLGRAASKGCVRVPAAVNRFLDVHGVLDADYEQTAAYDIRYAAVLLPQRQPSPVAGNLLVVIDSSS